MVKSKKTKRGGSYANKSNTHNSANFSSDQGLVSGCAGCVGGNVAIGSGCNLVSQAAAQESANRGIGRLMNGIRGQVGGILTGGGNTAATSFKDLENAAKGGMGFGRVPVTSVSNCGVTSSTSMGAGQRATQKGGNATDSCVAGCNNLGTPGYGLNIKGTSDLNAVVMGSGYPVVSPYNTTKCGGKRKRRKNVSTKRKRKGTRKGKRKRKRKGKRKGKHGTRKRKRKGRRKGRRKTMKGGYAQFASNDPNAPGFSSPKLGPLPWATAPLSKSRYNICQNNYNHFTGKSSPSGVYDQAAPEASFGGA